MSKPIGGRGKRAPYISTHIRLPEPLKERVENLKQLYLDGQLEHHDDLISENQKLADEYRNLLTGNNHANSDKNVPVDVEECIEIAKKILKSKKNARESITRLINGIYGVDIKVDDLKD